MNQLATITSKQQLTIPVGLFRKAGLRIGQKVIVSEENGRLVLTPTEMLVEELAGSIPMLKEWEDKDIDQIIEEARDEYFKEKYQSK